MAIFKKLNIGDTVASSGARVFKKLITEETSLPIWNGTDLRGTTWTIPHSGWTAEAGYGEFDVVGKHKYIYELDIYSFRIGYDVYGVNASYTPFIAADSICWNSVLGNGTIHYGSMDNNPDNDGSFVIAINQFTFTGGTDTTNPRLIDWLINNADLVSHQPAHKGGLYDANNNLVASWNALVYTYGMDVEKDYTSSDYNTDTASPYCVLTNNSELSTGTKLVISDSITSIGNYALTHCDNLASVVIGDGVVSIGRYAFYFNNNLTSIIIPNGVTTIGANAFRGCTGLVSVVIGDSVVSIGANAFTGCNNLSSVVIGDSVTRIGNGAFFSCDSLTSITIPDSVTRIDDQAFDGCPNLTNITIGKGLTYVGWPAFDADVLKNVYVPNLALLLNLSCKFEYGSSITQMSNLYIDGVLATDISIPDGVTKVTGSMFRGCRSIINITIPDGVTRIGEYALFECTNLTSVTIPDSVMKIENNAFNLCTSLTDIYFRGSEEQWNAINIDSGNNPLTNATIHYNSL